MCADLNNISPSPCLACYARVRLVMVLHGHRPGTALHYAARQRSSCGKVVAVRRARSMLAKSVVDGGDLGKWMAKDNHILKIGEGVSPNKSHDHVGSDRSSNAVVEFL